MEVALRETASRRLLFVLNHSAEPRSVALPADKRYTELLSRCEITQALELTGYDVRILEERS